MTTNLSQQIHLHPFPDPAALAESLATTVANDLRTAIGLGATEATATHVIVVVDVEDKTAGLLVDSVSDIVDVPVSAVRVNRRRSPLRLLLKMQARLLRNVASRTSKCVSRALARVVSLRFVPSTPWV